MTVIPYLVEEFIGFSVWADAPATGVVSSERPGAPGPIHETGPQNNPQPEFRERVHPLNIVLPLSQCLRNAV
jgi:hypothetical protein